MQGSLLDMTGAQLRAFLAVAEYGGFSAAAQRLNVAQPTISKAIRSLEQKTGALFERSRGKAAVLSAVGDILRQEAPLAIQHIREIERKIDQRRQHPAVVRIAVGEYLYERCKDAVARYAATTGPALTLSLEMLSSRTEALRSARLGEIDILVMSQMTAEPCSLRMSTQTSMRIYRSATRADRDALRPILPVLPSQELSEFLSIFERMGVSGAADHLTVPNYHSVKSMVIAGHGQALLFAEDAEADVAAGRLVHSVPGSIQVRRGCLYYGDSALLETLARYLVSAIGATDAG